MTCPSDKEIASSLDGAPAGRGAAPVEAHLEECPACRARAARILSLDAALAAGLLARDRNARRIPPRLKSRLVAIGEDEYARRAGLRSAAAEARRRRISARLREPATAFSAPRRVPAALAAAVLLAGAAATVLWLESAAVRGEQGERRLARPALPELRIDAPAPRAGAVAAVPLAQPDAWRPEAPQPGGHVVVGVPREGLEEARPDAPNDEAIAAAPVEGVERPAVAVASAEAPSEAAAAEVALIGGGAPADRPQSLVSTSLVIAPDAGSARPERVVALRGDLRLRREGAPAFARAAGRIEVAAGDTLRADGPGASFLVGAGVEIAARAGTELTIARRPEAPEVVLSLAEGEMLADLPAEPGVAPLSVRTRHGVVDVKAGRVAIQLTRAATRAVAIDGLATLESAQGEVRLGRGEAAAAALGVPPVARRAGEQDTAPFAFAERLRARRTVVLQASFERGLGPFDGILVRGGAGATPELRSTAALELRPFHGDPDWGARAIARRAGLFRSRPGTEIRFAYFLSEAGTLAVQAYDEAQHQALRAVVERPVIGRWATASILVDDLAPSGEALRRPRDDGAVFSALEVLGGPAGACPHVLIDDLTVFERD
jgi:hypothetical protein